MPEPGPTTVQLVRRAAAIVAVLTGAAVRLLAGLALRRPDAVPVVAADTLRRLGPAFVKAGQLLSTRVDVLPPALCARLSVLYDRLPAPPARQITPVLPARLLADLGPVGVDASGRQADGLVPVAAGSIACVYRARLRDGRTVAVKVRRPEVDLIVRCDVRLLTGLAALAQRWPSLRGVPLAEMADQVGQSIRQQLDLAREAAALRSLRENLAGLDGVRVPAVVDGYGGPGVLVMEFVEGLRRGATGPAEARQATLRALRAAYHMLFLDGFVHCDLHPGNVYPMPDGSVVIVDAGFSRELPEPARRGFASFFYQMSRGDGAACADIVLSTARSARPGADPEGLRAGIAALVGANHGVQVADFDLVGFAVRLFALQREHGYFADPEFVFPILSLIVLEGTLRGLCPDVEFQLEALPFVLRGLMR